MNLRNPNLNILKSHSVSPIGQNELTGGNNNSVVLDSNICLLLLCHQTSVEKSSEAGSEYERKKCRHR